MKPRSWLCVVVMGALLLSSAAAHTAAATDCLSATPLPLQVRIGATPIRSALLVGGSAPALRIVDVVTGTTLWSADAGGAVTQRFAAMTASFAGSFIVLDTDRDGLHDRLYAGDLAGRLWRFDLHNGAAADGFASGGVFADFSNDAGRGFRAPPDVSLASPPGVAPWFNIALGTAAPGHSAANNRFYVLRDHAPLQAWSDAQYRDWQPLRETDLLPVSAGQEPARADFQAGWYIELQGGDVLAAALTVAGRTVFAIADASTADSQCRATTSIATLDLVQVQLLANAGGEWRVPLAGVHAMNTVFTLGTGGTGADAATARCNFGDARVTGCDVDLRPQRSWWRREDAE